MDNGHTAEQMEAPNHTAAQPQGDGMSRLTQIHLTDGSEQRAATRSGQAAFREHVHQNAQGMEGPQLWKQMLKYNVDEKEEAAQLLKAQQRQDILLTTSAGRLLSEIIKEKTQQERDQHGSDTDAMSPSIQKSYQPPKKPGWSMHTMTRRKQVTLTGGALSASWEEDIAAEWNKSGRRN